MCRIYNTLLLVGLLLLSIQISAQSFNTQVLNKEQFQSAVSLVQDYDNDGDLDIVLSRASPAGIYVLNNDGTKQFPASPIITENLPFYIADIDMADFDNDGDIDYVVCFTGVSDGELSWFQRQDDGSYIKWTIATNKDFIEAEVADFDGDGLVDIAAVGLINSDKEARVYINQGNLFFNEIIVAQDVHDAIDAADFDGDGDIDLALTGIGSINTQTGDATGSRILLNDGNANFSIGKWLNDNFSTFTSFMETIQIVDLNNDGVQDVLSFSRTASGGLKFFDGTAIGSFNDLLAITIDDDNAIDLGGHFVVFDIDNNGLLDIVRQGKGENRVSVLYQVSNMSFEREYIELNWDRCCNPTAKMAVGDLDNDGDLDLVFPEQGNVDDDVSWFENIDGQLYKHQIYGKLDGVRIPKMVDWDNDGDLDIFATVSSGTIDDTEDELILYENLDGENFVNWRISDALDYAADIEFADIDGDGDLDIFATARDADDLVWLRNDGFPANWVTNTIFPEGNTPLGIATDDLDNDGDADVVMCSFNDDKVFAFLNDGNGSFSPIVVDASIDGPREVEIADLDGDGDKDIAVVSTEVSNTLVVYLNNGAGSFSEQLLFSGKSGRDIEIADWDANGTLDIFISLYATSGSAPLQDVVGFYNDGNASFTTSALLVGGERTQGIRIGDLDSDGDLDITLGFDGNFRVLAGINNGTGLDVIALSEVSGGSVPGLDIGDINNDGTMDIVYADFGRDDLILLTIGCLVAPVPSITVVDATCDENNGTATVDTAIFTDPSFEWSNGAITSSIADLAAGEYEVTVTDSNGCSSTGAVIIEAIPVSEVEIEGTDTTCGNSDGTATINVISGSISSYEWSNGATTPSISNLDGGGYSVTVTDENNCTLVSSIDIVSLMNPTVNLGEDIMLNEGEGTIIDATGEGLIYEWSTGESTPTIMVMDPGVYSVTVTNSQGCTATDEVEVTLITSTDDLAEDGRLEIYPNPTKGNVLISIREGIQINDLTLMTSAGSVVWHQEAGRGQNAIQINLNELPNGLYVIHLNTSEGSFSRKIIKE